MTPTITMKSFLFLFFKFFNDTLIWLRFNVTHFDWQRKYYENFAFPFGALLFNLRRFDFQKWRNSYPNKGLIIMKWFNYIPFLAFSLTHSISDSLGERYSGLIYTEEIWLAGNCLLTFWKLWLSLKIRKVVLIYIPVCHI